QATSAISSATSPSRAGSWLMAREAAFSTQRNCSISSAASTASPMTRFLGLWNCSQSRSATKRCMASLSSFSVVVASGMVLDQGLEKAPPRRSAGPRAPSPARHHVFCTPLYRWKEGEYSDRSKSVKQKCERAAGQSARVVSGGLLTGQEEEVSRPAA